MTLVLFSSIVCIFLLFRTSSSITFDQLGIDLNRGLVTSVENVVYGSIVQIRGLKDWTDEQIVDLAFQAHLGMLAKYQDESKNYDKNFPNLAKDFPRTRPKVTSTIVIDNTAYISSSVVGGYYVYGDQNPRPNAYWYNLNVARFDQTDPQHPYKQIVKALQNCQLVHPNSRTGLEVGHRTGASCGEPMAAFAFCATNSQGTLKGAKIVSVNHKGHDNNPTLAIVAPCRGWAKSPKDRTGWGCMEFLDKEGLDMHVIPETTSRGKSPDIRTSDIAITYARYPGT